MGGGHDHGHEVKIPDYRTFKLENCPRLLKVQSDLAALGLKDPWLRNEVWRYDEKVWGPKTFANTWGRTIFRGAPYGFIAAVATVALHEGYKMLTGSGNGHGHGHGEHH